MRNHLTNWVWFNDRLCSLSSVWLVLLSFVLAVGLSSLGQVAFQFLDDLTFLLGENDFWTLLVLLELLFMGSVGLWVLACCLAALGRRVLLRLRGL